MKEGAGLLKEKGIVVTPQRLAVWKYIRGNQGHPCVEKVYEKVKEQFPSMSLATVYTVLETFCNAGLLHELSIRRNRACFDPRTENHHHFLCRQCNKIYDIEAECKIARKKCVCGHNVEDVHGYFYGVCKNCQKGGE